MLFFGSPSSASFSCSSDSDSSFTDLLANVIVVIIAITIIDALVDGFDLCTSTIHNVSAMCSEQQTACVASAKEQRNLLRHLNWGRQRPGTY